MRITIDGFSTYTRGTVRLDQMEDVIRHIDTTILQSAHYLQNKPNLHPWMPIKYRRIFLAQFKYLIIFSIYFKIYNFIVFILTTLYYSKTESQSHEGKTIVLYVAMLYAGIIQGVTGETDQTSGECSLGHTTYTDVTQNTYIQSSMFTEILARGV